MQTKKKKKNGIFGSFLFLFLFLFLFSKNQNLFGLWNFIDRRKKKEERRKKKEERRKNCEQRTSQWEATIEENWVPLRVISHFAAFQESQSSRGVARFEIRKKRQFW